MAVNVEAVDAFFAWLKAPYDPELAAAVALSGHERMGEAVLQRQAAFNPNQHLIVWDVFPLGSVWAVFCTQGHRFTGKTPLEAQQAAEQHLKEI